MRDLKAQQGATEGVPAAPGHSLRGPRQLERGSSALVGRGGVSDAGAADRVPGVRARGERADRTAPAPGAELHTAVKGGVCTRWWRRCRGCAGVDLTGAVTLIAEVGDLTRFDTPRKLMSYLGLTPSEYSSGERRRQGGITKAGNGHARRALVEGAWAYRYPAKVSRHLQLRLETRVQPRSRPSAGRPSCACASDTGC